MPQRKTDILEFYSIHVILHNCFMSFYISKQIYKTLIKLWNCILTKYKTLYIRS